jgi:hypothetical protein
MRGALTVFGFDPARIAGAVVAFSCAAIVAATGAAGLHGTNAAGVATSPSVAASHAKSAEICGDYMFAIDEVKELQKSWEKSRDEMLKGGTAWSAPAVLVQLNVNCELMGDSEDGIAWNGVFFDANHPDDHYWHSADGASYIVMEETAIDAGKIDFKQLAGWLDAAELPENAQVVSIQVTNQPDIKAPAEDHFSYVVSLVDKDMKQYVTVVDSRDGKATTTPIS